MPTKFTRGRDSSAGMDIMRRISNGELRPPPSAKDVEEVKGDITENCEELIEVGARIRPLLVDGVQVGWVRGIHLQERRMLKRWVRDPNDFVAMTLKYATSFSAEEIEAFQAEELHSLVDVVRSMSERDISLYPYLNAFVTTHSSESMWYGKGEQLTSLDNKVIVMPDGKKITIMAAPDHSRMWATLCSYREQAKRRLDDNTNAVFIVRPWAGKHADPIANELKGVAKQLETGSNYMWEQIVKVQKKEVNVNDGWGHPGDSLEDLQRELKGMMEGDRHESMMEAWAAQMTHEAAEKQKEVEKARAARGISAAGVYQQAMTVLTEKEIKERQAALAKGRQTTKEQSKRGNYELDSTSRQLDKIKKYR
jgi:hypothetical protein